MYIEAGHFSLLAASRLSRMSPHERRNRICASKFRWYRRRAGGRRWCRRACWLLSLFAYLQSARGNPVAEAGHDIYDIATAH